MYQQRRRANYNTRPCKDLRKHRWGSCPRRTVFPCLRLCEGRYKRRAV
jgi:hypothetical protein